MLPNIVLALFMLLTEATLALTLHYGQRETRDGEVWGEYDGSAANLHRISASKHQPGWRPSWGRKMPRGRGSTV